MRVCERDGVCSMRQFIYNFMLHFLCKLSECASFVKIDAGCCGDSADVKLWWCRINWKGVPAAAVYRH